MATTSTRFPIMGTTAEIVVHDGDPAVAHQARARLGALEARWSRFRPGSDVSALNRSPGTWVPVAWETTHLLARAVEAARATEGRFDPTVGGALIAHGYDRTFGEVQEHARRVVPRAIVDAGWPEIEIDPERSAACIPEGTTFDPGGIGKGLAADLVATELADQAAGLLVNVGGDVRMCGSAADPSGWVLSIEDPLHPEHELTRVALHQGAIATSSRCGRRWMTATGPAHHIIDPRTGRPAETGVAAVTVVAAEAWWAEVQATSLFLLGPGSISERAEHDETVEALLVADDGSLHATSSFREVVA